MGEIKHHFGDLTWIIVNPWNEAFTEDKNTLVTMVERHVSIMLCIGKVPLWD